MTDAVPTITMPPADAREADAALLALLRLLRRRDYAFVTPTPATHARIVARADRQEARTLADMLGWNLPFAPGTIDAEAEALLDHAGMLAPVGGRRRALVRVSSLGDALLLHSGYPTDDAQAVFFGPDSYRFADLIRAEIGACPRRPDAVLVDIGTGSGVGAIVAAGLCPDVAVAMTDINPQAIRFARINAQAAGLAVSAHVGSGLDPVDGPIDLAMANPPFIIDSPGRLYRDGGEMHGGAVSLDLARAAMAKLAPDGRLILYTGSAIVRGHDGLRAALAAACADRDCEMRYREVDPDVFGEELDGPAYREVDRIALVAAVVRKRGQAWDATRRGAEAALA